MGVQTGLAFKRTAEAGPASTIAGTVKAATPSTNNQPAYTSASYTPAANRILLAAVFWASNDSVYNLPVGSGNGLTWERVIDSGNYFFDTTPRGVALFAALTGAVPSAGGFTATFPVNQVGCGIIVSEFDGTNLSSIAAAIRNPRPATAIDQTTGLVTLPAFANVANGTFGAFAHGHNETHTPGSGFTELGDINFTTPNIGGMAEWKATNDTSVDASWATLTRYGGVACELVAAVGSGDDWWDGDSWVGSETWLPAAEFVDFPADSWDAGEYQWAVATEEDGVKGPYAPQRTVTMFDGGGGGGDPEFSGWGVAI